MRGKSTMTFSRTLVSLFAACACLVASGPLSAHGFAGKRFFPATLATEDPFVADELSLPTISSRKAPSGGDAPNSIDGQGGP